MLASPPLLYAGAFAIGSLCQWMVPTPILPAAVAGGAGLVVLLCGAVLAAWSRRTLEAESNIHPALPAIALVVTGPFRLSRNPMYVARTLLYVGLALLANALWVLCVLVPLLVVVHYGVIRREERYLEVKFGDAYRRYRAGVRRWI